MKNWLQLALSKRVFYRALGMGLIVGPILVLINQGDYILFDHSTKFSWIKLILTFMVPYMVSTVSSVIALRESRETEDT
ncbi:MAG: nitrate/nitrite transporter NrtS [Arenicellales bacterium]|nr:nitrate/nitrite transporter NrtS [Arenicellales bacterium]